MKVNPYVILGTTQLASLQASLQSDLDDWVSAWFGQEINASIEIMPIKQDNTDYCKSKALKIEDPDAIHWAVYAVDDENSERMGSLLLCNQDVHSRSLPQKSIIHDLVRQALLDLTQRLLRPDGQTTLSCTPGETVQASLPADAFKPGIQALELIIAVGGLSYTLWVSAIPLFTRLLSLSEPLKEKLAPLVPPRKVLTNQQLTARAVLGAAELTLGALTHLKIGNVIRLEKELQEPLTLVFKKSPAKFSGYLGRRHDQLAFQIHSLLK